MNVLMVGNGKGSWTMRGLQLGAAIGAHVTTSPTDNDWRWADLVVLIKRAGAQYAHIAQHFRKPIVWDALDFWRQPTDNLMPEHVARHYLTTHLKLIEPILTIGATRAMAEDAKGVVLRHHSWAGLVPTPPREDVQTVAYEGNALYLGAWQGRLEKACQARGWRFVVNPPDLSQVDLLVALREGQWDGWMSRRWKSGVKISNAIAAGRPLMTQPNAAAEEAGLSSIRTIETEADLLVALDALTDLAPRDAAYRECCAHAEQYTLSTIAAQYTRILSEVMTCPA